MSGRQKLTRKKKKPDQKQIIQKHRTEGVAEEEIGNKVEDEKISAEKEMSYLMHMFADMQINLFH